MLQPLACRRQRPGAYAVEFAVVAVILFLFIFGIIEYSRLIMIRQVMDNAVREGARYSVVHTYDKTTADVENQVRYYLAGQDAQLKNVNIEVYWCDPTTGANLGDWADAQFGQAIAVEIKADFRPILPSFLGMPDPLPLTARSIMFSEAN